MDRYRIRSFLFFSKTRQNTKKVFVKMDHISIIYLVINKEDNFIIIRFSVFNFDNYEMFYCSKIRVSSVEKPQLKKISFKKYKH